MLHAGRYASFSRDGRYLAYQTFLDPQAPGREAIGVCWPDGSHDTPFGGGSYAVWAPNADRIAYVTRKGYLTVSAATGRSRWTLRGMTAGPIAWAADGKTIFFAHSGPHPGLFSAAPGARRARRLVDLPAWPRARPVAAWIGGEGKVRLLTRTSGGKWKSRALSPPGERPSLVPPAVAVGADGDMVVAWASLVPAVATVSAIVRDRGMFTSVRAVSNGPGFPLNPVQLAVDGHGNAVAAWQTARSVQPIDTGPNSQWIEAAAYEAR